MRRLYLYFMFSFLVSMISISASAYNLAVENEDGMTVYYNFTSDGTGLAVTYNDINGNNYSGNVVIPDEVIYEETSYNVVAIERFAFYKCYEISSLTIPHSITNIDSQAFYYCKDIEKVIVEDIASWCNISFGDNFSNPLVVSNGLYNIDGEQISDLQIPEEVTSISNYAFYGCSGITSVKLLGNVRTIGFYAFYGCVHLSSFEFSHAVEEIGNYAFSWCKSLTSITIPYGVHSVGV